MNYLIFDFDGVLGDTNNPRIAIIKEMEGKSDEEVTAETEEYFAKSSHTRDLNLSQKDLEAIMGWTNRFGEMLAKKGFELFTDFIGEIKKIKNTKIAVVSSGSSIYIKPKLQNCGLEFSHILTMEDHHSKEEKVEKICKDWNISTRDAYFFTDTVSDVRELSNIMEKNKIYGCAWGYQGAQKLLTILDENHILYNFSDIQKVFAR